MRWDKGESKMKSENEKLKSAESSAALFREQG
jgi:hypothetical protein